MQRIYMPEGRLLNTVKNRHLLSSIHRLEEAAATNTVLEALALSCDSAHNLNVDLGVIKGIIPRSEGAIGIAEGLTRDIALISRVGKPVSFIIDGFTTDGSGQKIALLSRRKAQEMARCDYISSLSPGDVISARVTHLESFGAFCDIGCGHIALMPIDTISVSRISHPKDRFSVGEDIKAVVKSIIGDKITLSMKELLGSWMDNANYFNVGETVSGVVRSVESYGIFIELAPNLAGLAELKDGVEVGHKASVYIKSILPEKMKVKLIIVDSFPDDGTLLPIKYFIKDGHLNEWQYSPNSCCRHIVSTF